MAAAPEPEPSRRGGDRRRDRTVEPRRRGESRHSIATADPLYWARARAQEATADATTEEFPVLASDGAGTTVDLPAISDAETVDSRERPLAALVPAPGRSALARRGYTGRHRPPETTPSTRLGLSTAGMTVAVGVLGATLAMLHVDPDRAPDRPVPPLAAVSPTSSVSTGTGTGMAEPRPDPGGSLAPGASPVPPPPAGVASAQPSAGQPAGSSIDDDSEATGDDIPRQAGRPSRSSRPTRTRNPAPAPTQAATCRPARALLAADPPGSVAATVQANDEETEAPTEETEAPAPEPSPSAAPSAATNCR